MKEYNSYEVTVEYTFRMTYIVNAKTKQEAVKFIYDKDCYKETRDYITDNDIDTEQIISCKKCSFSEYPDFDLSLCEEEG